MWIVLPFKIRTISLDFLGRAVRSSEFPERVLGNGLVIAEMDEFCFFPGKPDSSQFRLNRLNNGSAETAGDNPFQPDNRHSGLPQRLCGNSISNRTDRKKEWYREP